MLNTVEKVLLLQELKVFREATSEQLANLAIISEDRNFEEGAILFEKGSACDDLQLLVDGKVQIGPQHGNGRVIETAILDPLCFFAQQSHSISAKGLSQGILLEAPRELLTDLLTSEGEFSWIILTEVARIGRQLMSRQVFGTG